MDRQRDKTPIHNLPREILEAIFDSHVNLYRKSRYPLLLTCRMWYAIATTYPALWSIISLCWQTTLPPETVQCPNLEALALAINRTGGAHFELYLGESFSKLKLKDVQYFVNSVDRNWLSRCTALTVSPQDRGGYAPLRLGVTFFSCGLDSLRRLEIRHYADERKWEHILQPLMERVDSSSLSLHELRVRIMGYTEERDTAWITQNIYKRPNILKRIAHLMLRDTSEPIPWGFFTNIETIEVWGDEESYPLVKLDVPAVKKLSLGGIDNPRSMISTELCNQLTHLTIKNSIDEFGPFILDLPSLTSLGIIVCSFDLRHINAPKLEELTYRVDHSDVGFGPYDMLEEDAPFTPRIVHIDVLASEFPEDDMYIFGTKLPLWSKVEELHLKVIGEFPFLDFVVVNAISGVSPERCYPKLHSLTVLYPVVPEQKNDDPWSLRDDLIEEMGEILGHRRRNKDLPPLRKLEMGWYVEWGDDYVESEWKVVEWDNCLRW
ncbi:hypothetical protein M408DRAFT_182345 [Serendipita vermifera MAFF 305830]|uniref:Uncharacterized protein n=1 Tax=Serendipita vermifera MAFF 305830 TaxID=933852 RepID=A0A0C2WJY9_SERVB|nr:hypothetical protein M408DRAFT_182345 [Serendipita vermifera MAFF 305830]